MTGPTLHTKWKGRYARTWARGFWGKRWHVRPELWWDEAAKPCSVCGLDGHWRRPLKGGAATHPLCETSAFETVTDQLYVECLLRPRRRLGRVRHDRAHHVGGIRGQAQAAGQSTGWL